MKKKLARRVAAVAACLLAFGAARGEVELVAATVGKGDAIVVRAGEYVCLVDTGKAEAQEQLEQVLDQLGVKALDAVFITHTDRDHTGGLKWLRKSGIEIRAIYASRYFPESSEKKHPAVKAAKKLGLEVNWLGAGESVAMGDSGAVLQVLAPEIEIPDNEDDNSLVMMLDSPDGRVLLAGDMERAEEARLLASGADLRCDVLKVPNHADSDACGPGLIAACESAIAVISTDSAEKSDTPDPVVMKNLEKAGCAVFVTQNCSFGVRVVLSGGAARAEYVNW